jgi:hypothetical protein
LSPHPVRRDDLRAIAGIIVPTSAEFDVPDPDDSAIPVDIAAALTRAYRNAIYRNDRVVRSLGLDPRPPHPRGHELEDGDWPLLDPVRARAPMWRRP